MKLLVLAQTPPPLHGQSVMVRTLVEGLPAYGVPLRHVNLSLSHRAADVGRWQLVKIWRTVAAAWQAIRSASAHGCDTLYYIPAPAKRGALYRDWVVMLLCRPFYHRVVLHWHAAGLGEWLLQHASALERTITRRLLGNADLAIVLGENLRADAAVLRPRQIAVVRNGIADPCPGFVRPARPEPRAIEAIFLGLCTREKGLFAAIEAVRIYNAGAGRRRARLTAAGEFPDAATAREFAEAARGCEGAVVHVGFIAGPEKQQLFAGADVLLFPTVYPHETQGLVVVEALAHDLPVIVTRYRAVHECLPDRHVWIVEPERPDQIAEALADAGRSGTPEGQLRRHFLAHLTREQHLTRMAEVLLALSAAQFSPAAQTAR